MHVPIYRAIDWIAHNVEWDANTVEEMAQTVPVALVADLFDKDQTDIARRVIERRKDMRD